MLTTGAFYNDPGGDFYTKRNPDKAKQRALDQLRQMGYVVTLDRLPTASIQMATSIACSTATSAFIGPRREAILRNFAAR